LGKKVPATKCKKTPVCFKRNSALRKRSAKQKIPKLRLRRQVLNLLIRPRKTRTVRFVPRRAEFLSRADVAEGARASHGRARIDDVFISSRPCTVRVASKLGELLEHCACKRGSALRTRSRERTTSPQPRA